MSAAAVIAARRATAADMTAITRLLQQAGLPTADLIESQVELTVLTNDGKLLGVGGLEYFGHVALLRSLAISTDGRGHGLGTDLLAHLERRAAERGVSELVLLTQSADRFFANNGYAPLPRESAPVPIKTTAQFRSLCPDSALCMSKRL